MKAQTRKKKVGLALSGGAARGFAHFGVLRVLHDEGVRIDMISGTSAGAVVGAAYACDLDIARSTREALDATLKGRGQMIDPSFPTRGLIKGKKIMRLIEPCIGGCVDLTFADLKIPFVCVATNIITGEEVVIDSGPVMEALRASISIPGIFTVVKCQGRYLVDGGLTTPVPVDAVKNMGADIVIAVNVNPDVADRKSGVLSKVKKSQKAPNIFQVLVQATYITTYSLARSSLLKADVVIEPPLADIGAGDFNRAQEILERGETTARQAMAEVRRVLGE